MKQRHLPLFLMLAPVLLYYAIFQYGPMYGIQIAFMDFYPLKGMAESPWVGFQHFQDLFSGLYFGPVLANTLIISFLKILIGFPAPILLALIINEVRVKKFKTFAQTVTYLPHIISWVVLAGLVIEVLSPSRGPINWILTQFSLKPIFFVADEGWFRPVLVLSAVWREMGFDAIIYLAALASIDPELYDVAALDGAGRLQRIWHITLPSIMPVVVIMFIFTAGNLINDDFDQIYNLLNANVMSVGDVISTYTYREGIVNMNYSFATAVGLFKNVIAFSLVLVTNTIAKRLSGKSVF